MHSFPPCLSSKKKRIAIWKFLLNLCNGQNQQHMYVRVRHNTGCSFVLPNFLWGGAIATQKDGSCSWDSLGCFRESAYIHVCLSSTWVILLVFQLIWNSIVWVFLLNDCYCRNTLNIGFIRLYHKLKYIEIWNIGVIAGMLI